MRAKDTCTVQAKNVYLFDGHSYRQPYLYQLDCLTFDLYLYRYLHVISSHSIIFMLYA